jgi:hypothetical protein
MKPLYHVPNNFHHWDDPDCDWEGLYASHDFIYTWLTRLGRISVHSKEKFGSIRVSVYFWDGTAFGLIWPSKMWYGFLPKWLQPILCHWRAPRHLVHLVHKWQRFVYRAVYRLAFARWPHLWLELGMHAQHELLGLDSRSFGWQTVGEEDKE